MWEFLVSLTALLQVHHSSTHKHNGIGIFPGMLIQKSIVFQIMFSLIWGKLVSGIQQRIAAAGGIKSWLFNFGFSLWVSFHIELPFRERFWQALDLKLQCTRNCWLMAIVFALHPLHYFYQFGMSKDETKSTPNMENRSLNLGVWDGYNFMAFFFILAFLWRWSKLNWLKQGYNQDKASPLFDYLVFNKVSSNWILFCVLFNLMR